MDHSHQQPSLEYSNYNRLLHRFEVHRSMYMSTDLHRLMFVYHIKSFSMFQYFDLFASDKAVPLRLDVEWNPPTVLYSDVFLVRYRISLIIFNGNPIF